MAAVRPAPSGAAVVAPASRPRWQRAVAADPDALAFQSPEWMDALVAGGLRRDASREYDLGAGRILVLPLVRWPVPPLPTRPPAGRASPLRRLTATESLPYGWGTGGIVAADVPLTAAEAAVVVADLRAQRHWTVIRPAAWQSPAWQEAAPDAAVLRRRAVHVLDLAGGVEEVWARRFSSKVRNRTRKALRAGVEVERDDTGRMLPEVHRLYHRSVPRWAAQDRLPAPLAGYARLRARLREPAAKYAAVGAHLGGRCVVWLARVDGRPAAAIVVLYQGATANYWRGAMDKALAGPVAANDLLHQLAIEEACRRGCHRYSMGETAPGSSLARFKESFGAVPVPAVDLALGPP